jgi:uncharacterized protein YdeI (YjbR/CyaY-like superfamily)
MVFYKKHTGKPGISYDAAVEEALCFGWIDSIVKKIDEEKFARKFTPRKSRSRWSELNKKRARKMIDEGKMVETGLARIRDAKESGEWFKSDLMGACSEELKVPPYFEKALEANAKARKNFNNLAPTYRRHFIGWVSSAKREETRKRRLQEAVQLLEQNKKLGLK